MQVISESEYRKQIKGGTFGSALFFGEEDYLKSHTLSLLSEAACPDPSAAFFDLSRLDYADYTPEKLTDLILPLPMMSEKKLISLTGFDFNGMKQSETDELCRVLELAMSYEYNVIVVTVASGNIDEGYSISKPSAVIKKLGQYLTPVKFEKSTPEKLALWSKRHFDHGGIKADTKTLEFFIGYCGSSMYRLANEIEKLCAYLAYNGRDILTENDIRNVTSADTEFDAFALAGAIMENRREAALSVLEFLKFKRTDPLMIFGEISKTVCDLIMIKRLTDDGMSTFDIGKAGYMNEYRAKIYARSAARLSYEKLYKKLEACNEADRLLKLSSGGYSPIEMLICS